MLLLQFSPQDVKQDQVVMWQTLKGTRALDDDDDGDASSKFLLKESPVLLMYICI